MARLLRYAPVMKRRLRALDIHRRGGRGRVRDLSMGSRLTFEELPEYSSVSFHDTEKEDTGKILWRFDGTGYIEWPDYRDGERSRWDNTQHDIDCIE